jgi:hypothetical protein
MISLMINYGQVLTATDQLDSVQCVDGWASQSSFSTIIEFNSVRVFIIPSNCVLVCMCFGSSKVGEER